MKTEKRRMMTAVAAIAVIAVMLFATFGITYSWFTDKDETEVDVTAGTVDVEVGTWSQYLEAYVYSSEGTTYDENIALDVLGTATEYNGVGSTYLYNAVPGELTLTNMVAGDTIVNSMVDIINAGTIDIKYRLYVTISDCTDPTIFEVTATGTTLTFDSISEYTSAWAFAASGASLFNDEGDLVVSVGIPISESVGASATITVGIEAIQANAVFSVLTESELSAALVAGLDTQLSGDIIVTSPIVLTSGAVLDLNGYDITVDMGSSVSGRSFLNLSGLQSGETVTVLDSGTEGEIKLADDLSDVPIFRINNSGTGGSGTFAGTLEIKSGSFYTTDHAIIFVYGTSTAGKILISGGTFSSDYACLWLGNEGIKEVEITGGTFTGRYSTTNNGGLGLYLGSNTYTSISNATITSDGNTAVEIKSGEVTIINCNISSNAYEAGGDIGTSGSGSGVSTLVINNGYCSATSYTGDVKVTISGSTTITNTASSYSVIVALQKSDYNTTNSCDIVIDTTGVTGHTYGSDICTYYYNTSSNTITWNNVTLT